MTASSDVAAFADSAREWLAAEASTAPPNWGAIMPPEAREAGMEWQQRLFAAGFAGIHWPEAYGGQGLSVDHHRAWMDASADAGVPPFLNMVGLVLAAGSLMAFGTEEQRIAHLPPTVKGERVWCQLFSEPDAGSDLASLRTRAELDGDEWIINGQKVWCSGGRASDWGILLARTGPEPSDPDAKPHAGISFFLIDMTLPGVETKPLRQMTGEAEFDEVFLSDVRLPADCLIGEPGQGWAIAMATLMNERGHIGALGRSLTGRLEALRASGESSDRLAELYVRGSTYLAMIESQGSNPGVNASLGKLAMTRYTFDLARLRADQAGAEAMLTNEASAGLLAAPGAWFGGGTAQVQANIIGERILGLPREPRPK